MNNVTHLTISASLVLYRADLSTIERVLLRLQEAGLYAQKVFALQLSLTLVDNSNDDQLHKELAEWVNSIKASVPLWGLQLIRSPGNVGYGQGNNQVIRNAKSDYHIVINPDLFVERDSLLEALQFMESNGDVGLLSPAVFGEDGVQHYLCKRNPTLLIMFLRGFSPRWLRRLFHSVIARFEMRDCDYGKVIHPIEYPTGCFMFCRTRALQAIGGFDPRFFLHYEDADLGRRLLKVARTVFVPSVRVTHRWARDTHRSFRSRLITIQSGWKYWRQWGGILHYKLEAAARTTPCSRGRAFGSVFAEDKQIVITGANGFIGAALLAELMDRGASVVGVTRRKLPNFVAAASSNFIIPEITEHTDWAAALSGVDCVVHLAARVHQMQDLAIKPLEEYRRTNVALTLNLARQAASANVRRFVFVSSIKVNGDATPFGQAFTADDQAHPVDAYAISKFEAEQELKQLAEQTGMEVVIVRPVLVYGPKVKANFEEMMRWVRKGVPLPFGALDNKRSLVALDNLVDLLVTCINHPRAANQTFLVSDGEDLSVAELLDKAAVHLGRSSRQFFVPIFILKLLGRIFRRDAAVQRLCNSLQVDITKTRRILGWEPPISVDVALEKTARSLS